MKAQYMWNFGAPPDTIRIEDGEIVRFVPISLENGDYQRLVEAEAAGQITIAAAKEPATP